MERLSKTNKVLFIESLGLRQPMVQGKDIRRIMRRLKSWFRGVRRANENLYVFSPLVIPFHRYSLVRKFNHWFLGKQLNAVVRKLQLVRPILWSYIPTAVEYLGVWGEQLSVYHCVDDLSANPLIPRETVLELERQFLAKVDVVFTTSRELYKEKLKYNSNTYYMPNVADFAHFNKAIKSETVIPGELNSIPSPRLGFIGAVSNYKLDFDIVKQIAETHPEWSVVLIGAKGEGEKEADLGEIENFKNVYILGGRPYAELPGYLKGFDVCLLPNVLNDYTRNMFPMKFFEYLSTGKPVVATALESIAEFKEYFYSSKSYEEFEGNIEKALKENDSELRSKRIELAKKYTWETRIEEMSKVIDESIQRRQNH
jgi:glycosyltransferase involved in cell wall biosynthesis